MLKEQDIVCGNQLLAYYRDTPFKDSKKVQDFVYADDATKLVMIKAFLNEVIISQKQAEVEGLQSKVTTLTTEIATVEAYTKP